MKKERNRNENKRNMTNAQENSQKKKEKDEETLIELGNSKKAIEARRTYHVKDITTKRQEETTNNSE